MMQIDYPVRLDGHGRVAQTTNTDHIRDMIEQVLFTSPGERVNRPDFGCGLTRLVFAPIGEELVTTTEYMIHGSLQQWLGHLITVDAVVVESSDSTIYINVRYVVLGSDQSSTAQFTMEV